MKTTCLIACALSAEALFAAWPLQERIDEIAADGGGTLTLTAGVYRTGAIFFKPGVNLHLEKGATILGVDEAEGYPQQETRIEGETCLYYPALINADRCDGFTISGEGVIDGHGANTWEEFWTKLAEARKKGGDFRNKALMRPRVLYVSRSKNVDVSGVTFKNSKFWTTHYYDCEDVVVHDCKIVAETLKDSKGRNLKGPSTDAIDIDKCRRFTVRNVDIAVNDDGVVVKGGKGAWANDYGKFPGNGPSTDVLVENCTFRRPTHSALTLGSECTAATNVTMRGCTMDGCGNMLNLKMRTDTPQRYANVLVENCRGVCKTFLRIRGWTQYHDAQGRSAADLMSYADGVTLRGNSIEAKIVGDVKPAPDVFAVSNLALDGNVIYQLAPNLPLKQDGYVVEKTRTGYVVKARERRAFLCANSESNRWMNASSYPFVRDLWFAAAKPVWPEGREKEWNCQAGFTAEFDGAAAKDAVLRYTGATMCRVFLNGEFLGYGPARAAHGFARVEELPLGGRTKEGLNVLAVEVAGYNCDSFYTVRQPSFLQAEIVAGDGRVLAATGVNGGFSARIVKERVRKVQRFSCQRPFSEAYELEQGWDGWRTDEDCPCEHVRLAEQPQLPLLPRIAPVPEYRIFPAKALVATGKAEYDASLPVKTPLSMTCTESKNHRHDGFKVSELEWIPYYEMQRTVVVERKAAEKRCHGGTEIPDGGFALYDFGVLAAGFPGLEIVCEQPCTIYFTFDEVLSGNGDVDFRSERLESCCNIVAWRLKEAGRYSLESFEPYAFRYAKIVVRGGAARVSRVHIREYENPEAGRAKFRSSDPALDKVFEAARKTFAENAVDGFTDCPGRERAGWNCDGFFTGRAAIEFTGNASVERLFLQNFLLPEKFPDIPDGMLPQCYPADFPDHSIIPNWAMWFVLGLDEYYARTGDRAMVDGLKPRVMKLMDFFWKRRNGDGLLEKLPNTVFIEWSRSNLLVKDVNYPTNMTWARLLDVVARLYGVPGYAEEAERVRETIRRQSWNGTFFVDRAIRQKDGTLKAGTEATETCQYYAFFFGTATPESHPELWKRLVEDFGPKRRTDDKWPAVAFSNAFIGNYLRFECLSKAGLSAQILEEAKGYFSFMAERTGTLWEHDAPTASCSHGFASHIAHVLCRDVLGVREIDRVNRKVALRFADVPLDWCEGEIPVDGGWIKVSWRRENGKIIPSFSAPEGWRIERIPVKQERTLRR